MTESGDDDRRSAVAMARRMLPLCFAFVGLLVAACDPVSSLAAVNDSDQPVLVRLTWSDSMPDDPLRLAWLVEPHARGALIEPAIGTYDATIEVLREDCSVETSWQSEQGGTVTIEAGGTLTLADAGRPTAELRLIPNVTACGARVPSSP